MIYKVADTPITFEEIVMVMIGRKTGWSAFVNTDFIIAEDNVFITR